MRKVDIGEKNRGENTSLEVPGALAHRLQSCTPCNAAPPTTPHPTPPTKSKMATIGPKNSRCHQLNNFFYLSTPSMKKVDDEKTWEDGKKEKIGSERVATNIVACQMPECQLTTTPSYAIRCSLATA